MKRTRRIAFMLVTVLVMSLMSISAFAKGGKVNVPTSGTLWWLDKYENKWEQAGSFTATYKKDGKITNYTEYDSKGRIYKIITYKWNGKGYLTKKSQSIYSYDWKGTTTRVDNDVYTYKYKGKLPKKVKSVSTELDYTDATNNSVETTVTTYSWNKKDATKKRVVKENGDRSVSEERVNKKGQYNGTWEGNSKVSYNKNGNIKKVTSKIASQKLNMTSSTKYNKNGYQTSWVHSYTSVNSKGVPYTSNYSASFVYSGSAKSPTQVDYTVTSSSTSDPTPDVDSYRMMVTGTKKVSRVWNCDKYGHTVFVVANDFMD